MLVFACYCNSVVNCMKFNIEGSDSMMGCEAVGCVCVKHARRNLFSATNSYSPKRLVYCSVFVCMALGKTRATGPSTHSKY